MDNNDTISWQHKTDKCPPLEKKREKRRAKTTRMVSANHSKNKTGLFTVTYKVPSSFCLAWSSVTGSSMTHGWAQMSYRQRGFYDSLPLLTHQFLSVTLFSSDTSAKNYTISNLLTTRLLLLWLLLIPFAPPEERTWALSCFMINSSSVYSICRVLVA